MDHTGGSSRSYQQYIATQSVAVLSSEEQEWLDDHGEIRVGYLKDDPGFSSISTQDGKLVGVINDYTAYASKCFEQPLKFNLVGMDSQDELIQAVKDDKIDMIFHVNQNPYYAEQNDLNPQRFSDKDIEYIFCSQQREYDTAVNPEQNFEIHSDFKADRCSIYVRRFSA